MPPKNNITVSGPEGTADDFELDLHHTCYAFDEWLAKSRLEDILRQVSFHIDATAEAHEKASQADATVNDSVAYFESLDIGIDLPRLGQEVDRISEDHPKLRALADEVRVHIAGLGIGKTG